jgi:hypothetical protein
LLRPLPLGGSLPHSFGISKTHVQGLQILAGLQD